MGLIIKEVRANPSELSLACVCVCRFSKGHCLAGGKPLSQFSAIWQIFGSQVIVFAEVAPRASCLRLDWSANASCV